MRIELELMETIENYLKGNLSEADKIAFEQKINSNPELKKEVELQKQVLKGIERTGLKQSAKQGLKKYKFNRNLKIWGLTGLTVILLSLAFFYVKGNMHNNTGSLKRGMSSSINSIQSVKNYKDNVEKNTLVVHISFNVKEC